MKQKTNKPLVAIVMGSTSDWEIMKNACDMLDKFNIPYETHVISAHRMPDETSAFAKNAQKKGIKVIIAGAGGAAHLAGVIAANTPLPVLGVPIPSKYLKGIDSLLSIVQMPKGIPVATLAIGEGGAANAAILALQILASTGEKNWQNTLTKFRKEQTEKVRQAKLPQ